MARRTVERNEPEGLAWSAEVKASCDSLLLALRRYEKPPVSVALAERTPVRLASALAYSPSPSSAGWMSSND